MLVNELHLAVAAQEHTEIVEPGDDALKLHTVDEEDGERGLCLADSVKERVLQVLFLIHGSPMPEFYDAASKRAAGCEL